MEEGKEKNMYELALLVKGDDDVARAAGFVKQYNGEMVSEPRAKKLALAYTIKGENEAIFVSALFRAFPQDVKQMEHDLSVRHEVLRAMIVKAPTQAEEQQSGAAAPAFPGQKRGRFGGEPREPRPAAPQPLSNEALEKKIEEILG